MSQTIVESSVQVAEQVVEAVYENGVFRPLSPPKLEEHQRVRLTVTGGKPAVPAAQTPLLPDDILIVGLDPDVADEIALSHEFSLHES